MDVFGKAALALAVTNPDGSSGGTVPAPRLHEALHAAVHSTTEFGDRGIEFCSQSLAAAHAKLAGVATAIQNGEFDFDGSREEKAVPPVLLRADEVKAEIREATGTVPVPGTGSIVAVKAVICILTCIKVDWIGVGTDLPGILVLICYFFPKKKLTYRK